jgi:translation initiation factor IF-2
MTKSKQKSKNSSRPRPPVVSILGHIDHGKTTLLDQIRSASVAASEAGGITQHIIAYQIDFQNKKITFIDTPGHAAFAKMRARGAKVTDLAVLVVAADEGVKPQTKESLKFIKEAKIPFLVAATKIDLESSSVNRVAEQLSKEGVLVEKKGGDIVLVPVSGKTGKGVKDLLEMILLLSEMQELKADPAGPLEGVVIESRLSPSQGPLATILVKNGTLSLKDTLWADGVKAKVKAMHNENNQKLSLALPGQPAEVLGFEAVPSVGALIKLFGQEKNTSSPAPKTSPKKEITAQKEKTKLRLILKADTKGTLEAVRLNLPQEVELISEGVGPVSESDVLLAQTTGASLVAFNLPVSAQVKKLAQVESVAIKSYQIIYELLEDIEEKVLKILEPELGEEILGEAEILKKFLINQERIAGIQVLKGRLARDDKLHLKRGEKHLGDCQIASLKQGKKNLDKAKAGEEFGVKLTPELDFKRGDMLVSFRKLPKKE